MGEITIAGRYTCIVEHLLYARLYLRYFTCIARPLTAHVSWFLLTGANQSGRSTGQSLAVRWELAEEGVGGQPPFPVTPLPFPPWHTQPLSCHESDRMDPNVPAVSFCRQISQKHNITSTCTFNKHLIPSIVWWSICRGSRTT